MRDHDGLCERMEKRSWLGLSGSRLEPRKRLSRGIYSQPVIPSSRESFAKLSEARRAAILPLIGAGGSRPHASAWHDEDRARSVREAEAFAGNREIAGSNRVASARVHSDVWQSQTGREG